jgi:trk system potassium uptake protein TrkH
VRDPNSSAPEGDPSTRLFSTARALFTVLAIIALFAAAMLRQPLCLQAGREMGAVEALFLAVSALTCNGQAVSDPSGVLSPLGWVMVLALVEAGTLAGLILGAWIVEAICDAESGRRGEFTALNPWQTARRVIAFSLALQATGSLLLLPLWNDAGAAERIARSVTTAIAATCHTGFSIGHDGLEPYRYAWLAHVVIVPLMVVAGLGYPVWRRVWHSWRARRPLDGFARLALTALAVFYLVGVVALAASSLSPYFYESLKLGTSSNMPEMGPLTWRRAGGALADASFLSVSSHNVGLSTLPLDRAQPAGWFAMIVLMLVGGIPGGAGGGVTAVGVAVLITTTCRSLHGRAPPVGELPRRCAAAVALWVALLVVAGLFLLCLFEPYPFVKLLMEVVAAVTSTSFSLGLTAELTAFGKLLLMALMLAGRLGSVLILAKLVDQY